MRHGKALIVALLVTVVSACATAGGGAGAEDENGIRPRDTAGTREASVHLLQAGLAEGDEAMADYREALVAAMAGIEEAPQNPKAYLLAGQAAIGLRDWVQADTMFDRALELYPPYQEDIEAEREDGWMVAYQAGAEALEAGELERAHDAFTSADMLFQGRPEARIALGAVYSRQGEMEAAAEAYLGALEIARDMPENLPEEAREPWLQNWETAALNAADHLSRIGDFDRAAEILEGYLEDFAEGMEPARRRQLQTALAGFYARGGDQERAEAIYAEILGGGEGASAMDYIQAGVGFFNMGDFGRAADSFAMAAEMNPQSRDALLNLVQSLYSQAIELEESGEATDEQLRDLYQRTLDAALTLRDMDPLNRNLISFMLRSYRALADLSNEAQAQQLAQATQTLFREYQNQLYEVSDLLVEPQGNQVQVRGVLTNLNGEAGDTAELQFEIVDLAGSVIGSSTIAVQVPAQGESVEFDGSVQMDGSFAGWRYSLVE